MTCVVAARRSEGETVLCADCCVSWELERPGSGRYVYRDELQKLYMLRPNVCMAVVGDLRPAQQLLRMAQDEVDKGPLQEKLAMTGGNGILLRRVAPGLIRHLWDSRSLSGRVDLAIGTDDARGNSSLFVWSSRRPFSLRQVTRGEAAVIGSIENDPGIAGDLREEIARCDRFRRGNRRLEMEDYLACVYDVLIRSFAREKAREQLVGGLFQIASSEDGSFSMREYEAEEISARDGSLYHVSMDWNQSKMRWVQTDQKSHRSVPLMRIDEADFRAVPGRDLKFTY